MEGAFPLNLKVPFIEAWVVAEESRYKSRAVRAQSFTYAIGSGYLVITKRTSSAAAACRCISWCTSGCCTTYVRSLDSTANRHTADHSARTLRLDETVNSERDRAYFRLSNADTLKPGGIKATHGQSVHVNPVPDMLCIMMAP